MLEPRLEVFSQALAMSEIQIDAYRAMLPKTKAKVKSIHTIAARIADKVEVTLRVLELQ